MTPAQMIEWACARFEESTLYYGHGTDNAYDEAVFMVLGMLHIGNDEENGLLDKPLAQSQIDAVKSAVEERIHTRKPAAYIVGEAWFAGLPFYVNEHVLVPRSPLAELIHDHFSPWCRVEETGRILDIGTGCGCIAIACALAFPDALVDAVDISPEALAVAAKNVQRHGVEKQVELIESDLFREVRGRQYDLIVANPPYVDAEDLRNLPPEYRHEPVLGLQAGEDGLDIARQILHNAADYLTAKGILVMETGNSQLALSGQYPHVPFLWLEFEHGGEGVFLLTRDEIVQHFPERSMESGIPSVNEETRRGGQTGKN